MSLSLGEQIFLCVAHVILEHCSGRSASLVAWETNVMEVKITPVS